MKSMCFTVILEQRSNHVSRFQELSRSAIFSALYEDRARSVFQRQHKILDKPIKSRIGNTITEPYIENFEVEMMPYEDVEFQEMKPSEPEA